MALGAFVVDGIVVFLVPVYSEPQMEGHRYLNTLL